MEKLREKLIAMGMSGASELDDNQIRGVAKAVGLEVPLKKREVKVAPYTNANGETYLAVQTDPYVIEGQTTKAGNPRVARGLFVRAEHLPQALEDLKVAQQLLEAESDEG